MPREGRKKRHQHRAYSEMEADTERLAREMYVAGAQRRPVDQLHTSDDISQITPEAGAVKYSLNGSVVKIASRTNAESATSTISAGNIRRPRFT